MCLHNKDKRREETRKKRRLSQVILANAVHVSKACFFPSSLRGIWPKIGDVGKDKENITPLFFSSLSLLSLLSRKLKQCTSWVFDLKSPYVYISNVKRKKERSTGKMKNSKHERALSLLIDRDVQKERGKFAKVKVCQLYKRAHASISSLDFRFQTPPNFYGVIFLSDRLNAYARANIFASLHKTLHRSWKIYVFVKKRKKGKKEKKNITEQPTPRGCKSILVDSFLNLFHFRPV